MPRNENHSRVIAILLMMAALTGSFLWKTYADLLPLPASLGLEASGVRKVQIVDRHYVPLTITYRNRWNPHDDVALHDIPGFLRQAFVVSEDQRFFHHGGVDWPARLHALWQNITALRSDKRGQHHQRTGDPPVASATAHPLVPLAGRSGGRSAGKIFSKSAILEFYLNQIPYAGQRRGVVQAARHYFDRDPDTLNHKEMLALVVMVRAPTRLDVRKRSGRLLQPIDPAACRSPVQIRRSSMQDSMQPISTADLQSRAAAPSVRADHFVQYIYQLEPPLGVCGTNAACAPPSMPACSISFKPSWTIV